MVARTLMLWCVLVGVASAAELAPHNRVSNTQPGVCFWACLESVGRQQAVSTVHGLRDDVMRSGIGRDYGARPYEIQYWAARRGFSILKIKPQPRDGLRYRTNNGQLVIATCADWFGGSDNPNHDDSHAVVVLHISEEPYVATDGNGQAITDYWVTYYDPNSPYDMILPWQAFGPRYAEGHVVEPKTLTPANLTVPIAAGGYDAHLSPMRQLLPPTTMSLLLRRNLETGPPTLGLGLDVSLAKRPPAFLGVQP